MSALTQEQKSVVEDLVATDEQLKSMTTVKSVRLSDAIRGGAARTEPAVGWGTGREACALHAAGLWLRAGGYI